MRFTIFLDSKTHRTIDVPRFQRRKIGEKRRSPPPPPSSKPGKLHLDYKMHPHFPSKFGGRVVCFRVWKIWCIKSDIWWSSILLMFSSLWPRWAYLKFSGDHSHRWYQITANIKPTCVEPEVILHVEINGNLENNAIIEHPGMDWPICGLTVVKDYNALVKILRLLKSDKTATKFLRSTLLKDTVHQNSTLCTLQRGNVSFTQPLKLTPTSILKLKGGEVNAVLQSGWGRIR